MKLYTEEQVKEAIKKAWFISKSSKEEILDSLTPIELPTDEEINEASYQFYDNNGSDFYFIKGAKWIRDKFTNTKDK